MSDGAYRTPGASERRPDARTADIGSASARSALLTVLGEFVLPSGQAAWTTTLVRALAELGVEEKAARQAIARTAQSGVLAQERMGRRVRWLLTELGVALLGEGATRIYGFPRTPHDWDGRWLIVNVAVPESRRNLRHRLRTKLAWLGMGSPSAGLWVVPDATKEAEVTTILDELGLRSDAFAWVGEWTPIGEIQHLLRRAWALDELALDYREFIDRFVDATPVAPVDAFVAQASLVHAWRHFPFIDPDLPASLLPANWPGTHAAQFFTDRHERWHDAAQRQWHDWVGQASD